MLSSFHETESEIWAGLGLFEYKVLFQMSSGPDAEDYLEGDLSQVSQSSKISHAMGSF